MYFHRAIGGVEELVSAGGSSRIDIAVFAILLTRAGAAGTRFKGFYSDFAGAGNISVARFWHAFDKETEVTGE